jgi:hypothetical protein
VVHRREKRVTAVTFNCEYGGGAPSRCVLVE